MSDSYDLSQTFKYIYLHVNIPFVNICGGIVWLQFNTPIIHLVGLSKLLLICQSLKKNSMNVFTAKDVKIFLCLSCLLLPLLSNGSMFYAALEGPSHTVNEYNEQN